jgi:hypothetical protein
MLDAQHEAARIASDWPIIVGGELPEVLANAIATLEAADAVPPPAPPIAAAEITPANATDALYGAADAAIRAEKFHQTKNQITGQLARWVLGAATQAAPEILQNDRMKSEFDGAVDEFRQAVQQLPDNYHDPAKLVARGPAAVEAYHHAIKAQGRLKKFDGFIASIPGSNLSGRGDYHVLRLLRPVDRAGYQGLLNAANGRHKTELSPVFLYAVENHIDWQLNHPAAQKEIADAINALPLPNRNRGW